MKKNNIFWLLLFFVNQLQSMELQEIIVEKQEDEITESKVSSLKILAAKAYAEKYKKLPEQKIPEECEDYLNLYLPVTWDLAEKQYELALKFGDEKRITECRKVLAKKYSLNLKYSIYDVLFNEEYSKKYEKNLKEVIDFSNLNFVEETTLKDQIASEAIKAADRRARFIILPGALCCAVICIGITILLVEIYGGKI